MKENRTELIKKLSSKDEQLLVNEIKDFIAKIKNRYDIRISVFYSKEKSAISLQEVEELFRIEYPEVLNNEALKSTSRIADIRNLRHVFCKICHELGYTKNGIAKYLGRHHATVINAINRVEEAFFIKDKDFIFIYNNIKEKVYNHINKEE